MEQTYYVYAAGLGGAKLVELDAAGQKVKGYVYGGGSLLAEQELYPSAPGTSDLTWQHSNPGSGSWVETDTDRVYGRREMDPLGADVGTSDPYDLPGEVSYSDIHGEEPLFVKGGDPLDLSSGCGTIDGLPASCSEVRNRMDSGTVAAEFLLHDGDGFHRIQSQILSFGVGVFGVDVPYLRPNNEWKPGDPLSELDWRALSFSFQPQKSPGQLCDDRLAKIFGGDGAAFATDRDPDTLTQADGSPHPGAGRNRLNDPTEDPRRGVAHIYANRYGDAVQTSLHTPNGWKSQVRDYYYRESRTHTPANPSDELQNFHRFTYLPGSLKSYGYSGGLVVSFIHTGPTDANGTPNPAVRGSEYTTVGVIGAVGNKVDVGGWGDGFNHTHIRFYTADRKGRMGKPVDPRVVFCKDLGFR